LPCMQSRWSGPGFLVLRSPKCLMRLNLRPARLASSTSATRAPRSSTGCSRELGRGVRLRIEDTDVERSRSSSEARDSSANLRCSASTGTRDRDVGDRAGRIASSERLHLYESYAKELLSAGQAYYCFCSQALLEADRAADMAALRPVRTRAAGSHSRGRRGTDRLRASGLRSGFSCPASRGGLRRMRSAARSGSRPRSSAIRGSARQRHSRVSTSRRRRRRADGDHSRDSRRGSHPNTAAQLLLYEALGSRRRLRASVALNGADQPRCQNGTARRRWTNSDRRVPPRGL